MHTTILKRGENKHEPVGGTQMQARCKTCRRPAVEHQHAHRQQRNGGSQAA